MTGSTLLIFLDGDDQIGSWTRLSDDGRGQSGAGIPSAEDGERIVAVAPADAVTLHSADLSGLATAQARAAARLLVADNSAASIDTLHVALGEGEPEDRMIGVVAASRMAGWLALLQGEGVDPDAVIPAPMLLPRPDEGFIAGLIGDEAVLRGRNSGFVDDPAISAHVIGDAPLAVLEGPGLDAAVAAGAAAIGLDLRQGPFARRRAWRLDWPLIRRLGWLLVAIMTVTLLISLARIARYDFAADALDLQARAAARRALPDATADPVAALEARLASLRGAGAGFTATAGALFAALEATPNVELAGLDFDSDGTLRAKVVAPGRAEAEALIAAVAATGFTAEAGAFDQETGRIRGEVRIK